MKIAVIGTGYVGLVSGACFADIGNKVICVDLMEEKILNLREGNIPFFEPGLSDVIKRNLEKKNISFTTDIESAVKNSDVIFLTVGTPTADLDGSADLTQFFEAAKNVAKYLKQGSIVVGKSTVPIGTHQKLKGIISNIAGEVSFDVVSNPEFLREGSAVADFMDPDRVVIGTENQHSVDVMSQLYAPLERRGTTIFFSNFETAETIKYASNAFLATKISFINEIASLCDLSGADVVSVAKGMGLDKRIGPQFLNAGPGYGGSCFPKDTKALAYAGRKYGAPQMITESVIEANEEAKLRIFFKIKTLFNSDLEGKTISIFGVTFKPDTDDMREAPSLSIIDNLLKTKVKINVIDPKGKHFGKEMLNGVKWFDDPYEAVESSDLVLILTDWKEFADLDLKRLSSSMQTPQMLDGRNLFSPAQALSNGFTKYFGNGRN